MCVYIYIYIYIYIICMYILYMYIYMYICIYVSSGESVDLAAVEANADAAVFDEVH